MNDKSAIKLRNVLILKTVFSSWLLLKFRHLQWLFDISNEFQLLCTFDLQAFSIHRKDLVEVPVKGTPYTNNKGIDKVFEISA